MSAIGINVSNRDKVNGWEALKPQPLNRFVVAYKEACYAADEAWAWYYGACDQVEYSKTKSPNDERTIAHFTALMNEALHMAEDADRKREVAYHQMNCTHVHREFYGEVEHCEDCGARF